MSVTLLTGQEDTLTINPLGAEGEPEPVTNISWVSSNPGVASVTPAADSLSATVASVAAGSATVTVTATNSAGGTLTASEDYAVAEPAVGLNLTASAPQAIPPTAAPSGS